MRKLQAIPYQVKSELKIGDRARYRGCFGMFEPVVVTIGGVGEKNGRRVYDTTDGRWGYADQFQPVKP